MSNMAHIVVLGYVLNFLQVRQEPKAYGFYAALAFLVLHRPYNWYAMVITKSQSLPSICLETMILNTQVLGLEQTISRTF